MPDFDEIAPNLTRTDGSPLTAADTDALHKFYASFLDESDAELERKRGMFRNRLLAPTVTVRGPEGVQVRRQSSWPEPLLDKPKHDLLTAIIQERTRVIRARTTPAPAATPPQPTAWTRYVAFTGGTGRAIWFPLGFVGLTLTLLKVFGAI